MQVILQRVCLLAKAVSVQPGHGWLQQYVNMLLSPEGEYLQASRGKKLLKNLQAQMADKDCPVTWHPPLLKIVDVSTLYQVCHTRLSPTCSELAWVCCTRFD